MKRNNKFFSMLYVVLCLSFFYLPILVTMIFSFNSSKSLTRFTGFSLRWYQELLGNGEVIKAVYVSVTIAIIATIVSTILGTITAIGLSKSKKVIKELLLNINNIPILNPEIVTAISLMLLFSSLGFRKGYLTMLLAHIAFCTPVCNYQRLSEGKGSGSEYGKCCHGPWGNTFSGSDKGYRADDQRGYFRRRAACIYHVI